MKKISAIIRITMWTFIRYIFHKNMHRVRVAFFCAWKNLFLPKNAAVAKSLAVSLVLSLCITVPLVHISHASVPYSYALYDKNGELLGASVASDGQWRFAPHTVPEKFEKAIIAFEDRRFYFHCGVDVLAIYRALVLNVRAGRIVSGGSTITMQTVRILEHNPPRTLLQKAKEAVLAFFYELRYTKRGVLELYAAHAPFGGNVVGIEAASWRYFNRPPDSLTWAETATLAVLPNAPSLVYPGANKDVLRAKRDSLLHTLHKRGCFDKETLLLSLEELLPEKPYDVPQHAPHYLERMKKLSGQQRMMASRTPEAARPFAGMRNFAKQTRSANAERTHKNETRIVTTLDGALQKNTTALLEKWSLQFSRSGINNAAAIIIDTQTGDVLAYCGNTGSDGRNASSRDVDIISSRRSSGSLLKPFLFAAMLDTGMLLPNQLVVDVPTRIGSYKPENNIPVYRGAVPAAEALSRSLNIPAVRELRTYGITAFLDYLKKCGFTTLDRKADDYGLPLILGGGEVTLEEATRAYAALMNAACGSARSASHHFPASTGAAYLTVAALEEGVRPDDEAAWQSYAHAKKIAWKTGTSTGNRDVWAIGTTKEYTVGVWVGNAEGHGRPDLKSIATSAPLMFDIFSTLPVTHWPSVPYDDLTLETVCVHSGYKAGMYCSDTKKMLRPLAAPISELCPYCMAVSLTPDGKYRASVQDMVGEYAGQLPKIENRFVLPPSLEYWYTRFVFGYKTLPPYVPGSTAVHEELTIIFPEQGAHVVIPIEIDGAGGRMVMQAVNRDKDVTLYWDIDGEYVGSTKRVHEMTAHPVPGKHTLTVTDSRGNRRVRTFEVLGEE